MTRLTNFTGSETCHACRNGLAQTGWRTQGTGQVPEYGPCPFCELGDRMEFPKEGKSWKTWGIDGYWRGREPVVVVPPRSAWTLSMRENALRMRLLTARGNGADVDPCVGVDLRDDAKRLRLVEAAVAKL